MILLGFFLGTLSVRALWTALRETVLITSMIMIIIGFASSIGWLLAIEQIPQNMARSLPELIDSSLIFMLSIMVGVLLLGCFIDGVTVKLLLVPILLPLVDSYGIDRVHFGIILQMSLILGMATPPLGIGLFVVTRISGAPLESVMRATVPYFVPLLIVLASLLWFPQLSLWLPNMIMGVE